MKSMQFSVRCVREALRRDGLVFTVRGWDMSDAEVWVEGVGRCWREKVCEVYGVGDLMRFLVHSGFESSDRWWEKIEGFCGGRRKWLYRVERLGAGE